MKSVVIFDSFFGNTEKVARAIADELAKAGESVVCRVTDFQPGLLQGAGLVVVGSPTRGFQASKPIQALLKTIRVQGVKAAAFDTRVDIRQVNSRVLTFMVGLFGYAAEPIARGLKKRGGLLAQPPEGFIVLDKEGPLKEGELERAAAWATRLAG